MNFRNVLIAFIISNAVTSLAQSYTPILADSNRWFISNVDHIWYRTDQYFTSRDSVIGGKTYRVMELFHYGGNCFLREDTVAKTLYYRQIQGYKEHIDILLYDFSLSIGDSMLLFNPNSTVPDSMGYYVLDSLSSTVLANGDTNDVYYLSNHLTGSVTKWIEGIGGLGLINAPAHWPQGQNEINLTCFFKDDSLYYQSDVSSNYGHCVINTVGVEEEKKLDQLEVYPNPTNGRVTILFPNFKSELVIEILDISGNIVYSSKQKNGNVVSIDIGHFETGMYFLKVLFQEQILVRKLIKD